MTFFIPGGAGIFSNTDAPDAAWEVLKWYTNSDGGEWALARAIAFVAGSPTRAQRGKRVLLEYAFAEAGESARLSPES